MSLCVTLKRPVAAIITPLKMEISESKKISASFWTSRNFILPKATAPTFLLPAPSLALQRSPRPPVRLPIHPKMPTVPSYFPDSTHDEFLARCHYDRGNHVRANTPKLMSSLDYEPAACCSDSDMADDLLLPFVNFAMPARPGFMRCASAEDSDVLARRHATGRPRFSKPKLMSSFNCCPEAHEIVKHHDAFTLLLSDAASAASTPVSSPLNACRPELVSTV